MLYPFQQDKPVTIQAKQNHAKQRTNAISGAPIIKGTNQLPNPPIKMGITTKKTITKACPVTISDLIIQPFPEGIYQIIDPEPHMRLSPHAALTPAFYFFILKRFTIILTSMYILMAFFT
jgi:hypothetical protein